MFAITGCAWNLLLRHLEPEEVAICTNAQPPATAGLAAVLAWTGLLPSKGAVLFFRNAPDCRRCLAGTKFGKAQEKRLDERVQIIPAAENLLNL